MNKYFDLTIRYYSNYQSRLTIPFNGTFEEFENIVASKYKEKKVYTFTTVIPEPSQVTIDFSTVNAIMISENKNFPK